MHTEQLPQLDLQPPEIEQGGAGECVHEKGQAASLLVGAMESRSEHPRVCGRVTPNALANGVPLECKGYGRLHVLAMTSSTETGTPHLTLSPGICQLLCGGVDHSVTPVGSAMAKIGGCSPRPG
jgi:hypothetical protein